MEQDISFEKSKLLGVYINEIERLASEIETNCEFIFNEAKLPQEGHLIQVSPGIHSHIMYVLINAANLKKLIFNSYKRQKGESEKLYEFRLKRTNRLQEIFKDIEITEIKKSRVRNTLEHFDEYLDEESIKFENTHDNSRNVAAYNMALSDWDVFNPRVYPIRLYIVNEKKFYNMGYSIDIGKMYEEAKAILNRLKQQNLLTNRSGEGGMLIIRGQ